MRLAIVATHPIQYQAPWFRALAAEPGLDLEVLFGHRATARDQAESGFGVAFEWDTPLLEGYAHRFLNNVSSAPTTGGFFGVDTPEVAEVLSGGRFDAVIVHGWHCKSYCQTVAACWRLGIPIMVRGDSHLRHGSGRFGGVHRVAYRALIPRFDACLAAGTWSREYFLHFGARPDRVVTVPHMVSPAFSMQAVKTRASSGETTFLFAGKLVEWKRPLDFLDAIRLARLQGAAVNGVVAGDGPERERCERFAAEHRLPVRFDGFLNQTRMAEAYAACDALVVTSRETWALVVNEAMACGRPAVVSDAVGCHPDLIIDGQTGFIYGHCDSAALAKRMAVAADWRGMGVRAQAHCDAAAQRRAVEGIREALQIVNARRKVAA